MLYITFILCYNIGRVGDKMRQLMIYLLITICLITGCSIHVINYDSVNSIIDTVLYKETKLTNANFEGYSFYLPQGTTIVDKNEYNLKIKDNYNYYYLYVDTIAYHYKTKNLIDIDNSHFYTDTLSNGDLFGYVDIKEVNDKYFVVIMYNYAKIESYVSKDKFNDVFANMCNILSSIKFNDKIIAAYVDSSEFISREESFDIFSSKNENDNFLTYEQEYGIYDNDSNNKVDDEDTIEIEK